MLTSGIKMLGKKSNYFILANSVFQYRADGGEVEVVCVDLGVGAGLVEWLSGIELFCGPGGEEFFFLFLRKFLVLR